MKKIVSVFFVAALIMGTGAKAQLTQGNFMVGANIADFKFSLNKGGLFSINLSPKLAFFVRNNIALGAYLDFGLTTAKDAGSNIDYGIGGLGRYYLSGADANVLRHWRLFFEGTVGINGTNPASGENTNGLGLSFGPGITHFITPNVGIEALVKYAGIVGFGNRTTSSDILLGVGLQVYLPSGLGKSKQQLRSQQ
jgi:hypothetical protein